jgi:hypothetical protein
VTRRSCPARVWPYATVSWLVLVSVATPCPQDHPEPPVAQEREAERATPLSNRLHLDLDKHVERLLAGPQKGGLPRFETSIEVIGKSPQVMFERFLNGADLGCGPTVRHLPGPYFDLAALVRLFKEKGPDRYFLYRVRRSGDVSYWLRDDRIRDALLLTAPGVTFELVAAFPDLGSATEGWRRMERGFETARPPSAWAMIPCRPSRH